MTDIKDLYIKNDLADYADERATCPSPATRGQIVRALLPDAEIRTHSTGSYQGTMGFVIHLYDYVWLIKEAYGSCSYCDGLLATENKISYGISMLNNAYCFETTDDALTFLSRTDELVDEWGWKDVRHGMIDEVEALSSDIDPAKTGI